MGVTDPLSSAELQTLENLGWRMTLYDANGSYVVPGFVDLHVHLTGGGRQPSRCGRVCVDFASDCTT